MTNPMTKTDWTAEEVWDEADRAGDHSGVAQQMLTYLADRIEADERAVTDGVVQKAVQAFAMSLLQQREEGGRAHHKDMRAALLAVWPNPPAQAAQMETVDRVFIEETGTDGKPTGYLNEMYGTLERSLRNRVEQDGMHGSYPDKLCIKAADAIANLRTALASQIDITNTERGHAELAARLLAAQGQPAQEQPGWNVPDGWVMVPKIATGAMRLAMAKADDESVERYGRMARAMLAASPTPPKEN